MNQSTGTTTRIGPTQGEDRVFTATRIVGAAIVPFLVAAAFLLFAFPERTGELFAWQINPPLTAYLLASAYVGGIWFFVGVALERRWHRVRRGFAPVIVFAGALLIATLLHLDKFSQNISFFTWITLYATTPFVVAALAWAQRRSDAGAPDERDVVIPLLVRRLVAAVGAAAFLFGAALFVAPEPIIPHWAWTLTPLTAQVVGAVLSLTGVVGAAMLWDSRWSAFRRLFQAQVVSLLAIAGSLIARWDDLLFDRPITPLFLGLVAVALAGYSALTVWMELRLRRGVRT